MTQLIYSHMKKYKSCSCTFLNIATYRIGEYFQYSLASDIKGTIRLLDIWDPYVYFKNIFNHDFLYAAPRTLPPKLEVELVIKMPTKLLC